jgi:phosphoglycolate phosphatase-like HAD superfamily hydrolase
MRAVLFDFDFTLSDSSPGVIECFAHGFARVGPVEAAARADVAFLAVLTGPSDRHEFGGYPARDFLASIAEAQGALVKR